MQVNRIPAATLGQDRGLTSGAKEHLGPPEGAPQRMGLVEGCRGQPRPSLGMQAVSRSFQALQLRLREELQSPSLVLSR